MMKVALILFGLLLVSLCSAGFVETVYTTTLTGSQAIPFGGYNVGNAFCILVDRDNNPQLDCQVQHNVTNAVTAAIHLGDRGVNGEPIFTFSTIMGTTLAQVWDFDVQGFDAETLMQDFLYGRFYVIVANEKDTIRGQLEQSSRFYSKLSAENTIPLASGTTSTGIATSSYSANSPLRQLSLTIVHDVDRSTSLELHEGAVNQVGSTFYSFPDFGNVAHGTVQLSRSEEKAILSDLLYLNVASSPNPTGAIRGQIQTIDYIGDAAFTAELSGAAVRPDPVGTQQIGCAIVTYDCETKTMEYLVMHGISDTTGAVIGLGDENSFGSVLTGLSTDVSPIFGAVRLTNDQVHALYTSQMFIQLYFRDEPIIRGTLNSDWDFYMYMSGSNELPAVSTPHKGCGLARIASDNILQFTVTHSISNAITMDIRRGAEGVAGPIEFEISDLLTSIDGQPTNSPVRGEFILDDDDLAALVAEEIYFQFPTGTHLIGEIRGQARRINPCVVEAISYSIDNESTVNPFSYNGVLDTGFSREYNILYGNAGRLTCMYSLVLLAAALVMIF